MAIHEDMVIWIDSYFCSFGVKNPSCTALFTFVQGGWNSSQPGHLPPAIIAVMQGLVAVYQYKWSNKRIVIS